MATAVKTAIVGCGSRGRTYARYALDHPGEMTITAVVEPNGYRRSMTGDMFNVPEEMRFGDIDRFLEANIELDAVINGTMDDAHYETGMKIMKAGYNMLIEKPICLTKDELMEMYNTSVEMGVSVMVCHVLRYAPFYVEIKKRVLSGELGRIHSIVTEENVSFHHMASAFIRGKWGNYDKCGSRILMSKCCHDLDIITWMKSGIAPAFVSSFGGLFNFIEKNAPDGAGERCMVDCAIRDTCEYDAGAMYLEMDTWGYYAREYLDQFEDRDTKERLEWSLKEKNPFGKCVWRTDNNVNDHQTVIIEFEDGCTVSHNLIGATAKPCRTIHIVGTKGEIYGEMEKGSFVVRKPDMTKPGYFSEEAVDVNVKGEGHGGGDSRLAGDFVRQIRGEGTSISTTAIGDSIYGHLIGFNAQEALEERRVVRIERLK
ncbi:MAG TPA: Gfo/Idh/MocA family oxidoreductase [Clostridia bacterium]|nr:Gfo/Idh/MocA family oxidoreductase [Clostridia bacterium]